MAAVVAVGSAGLALQTRTQTQLRTETQALAAAYPPLAVLQEQNAQLRQAAAAVAALRVDEAELEALRAEIADWQRRPPAASVPSATSRPQPSMLGPVYSLAQLDVIPRPLSQPRPNYPPLLRQAGITGEAIVEFIVDTAGRVREARATRFTHPDFAQAALAVVAQWTFTPGQSQNQPVNTLMRMPMVFSDASQPAFANWFQ